MTDRLLVFSHPKIQKLLQEKFITVACNDWYQRRRQDAEGEFFRAVANQGPRKGQGGSTRQGHYVLTASGKLLGYNNNRGPDHRLQMIHSALKKWDALPATDKQATVPPHGKTDARYHRSLPKGAQVIKAWTRAMEKKDGRFIPLSDNKAGKLAAVDHLWLRTEEIQSLYQILHSGGGALPKRIAYRIARYHLLDSTRGEPPLWKSQSVKTLQISLNAQGQLTGKFTMTTNDGTLGYQGTLNGQLSFGKTKNLTQFEMLAHGLHWGEGPYTRGARPGKTPLFVFFQLAPKPQSIDLIPPQGMHWEQGYWQAEK